MKPHHVHKPSTPGRGARPSSMDAANNALFGFTILLILAELLGAVFRQSVGSGGITVTPHRADVPLLFGLVLLVAGNFNYYVKVVQPMGEKAGDALTSMIGMLAMASLPVLLTIDALRPVRYLILTGYGVLVVGKNLSLLRRAAERGDERAAVAFRVWIRRAAVQTVTGLAAAATFYVLTADPSRHWLFGLLIETGGQRVSFAPTYDAVVDLAFSTAFFAVILTLFLLHHQDVYKLEEAMPADDA